MLFRSNEFPEETEDIIRKISGNGGTPLVVSINGQIAGVIELQDIIKPGIEERFERLRKMGVKTVMVTGDNPLTAKYIAEKAGVDDFIAEAKPEDKMNYIKKEQAAGKLVAMMGDGTNDAPALAQADVGVAMNSGTQAAKEAGNMVDLDNDPTKLIEIVEIGEQLLMTRGTLTTFSIANDVAKYFAIVPALFIASIPSLGALNVMHLHSPESAILSAVIFNALIIPLLIPLALRGVTYSTNVACFRVTVTDSVAQGKLVATARLTYGSETFVNAYYADLDYNALGGLTITKTLEGTSAPAGKFGFTISTTGDDVLRIAGTYSSSKIADGGTVTVAATSGEIVFTQNDAGKTWKYEVSEDDPGKGYTCKCSKWNVSVSVANDVENGRLLVTTTVSGEGGTRSWTYASGGEPAAPGATVAFVNRYAAMGSTADIVCTKELAGRLMKDGEFSFELVDLATDKVVATATNKDGKVDFGRLSYTAPGTYTYTAREVTDGLKKEGVTPVRGSFTITVTVTDEAHDGTLDCKVDSEGGLAFENSYGTGDAEIEVSGTKVLEGRDLREGEFNFTIKGEDGAPMPERTEVTNAKGGFSFGKITFTLDNVFGGVVIQDADGEAGQSGEVPSDEEPVANSEVGPRVEAPLSETGEKDAELEPAAPETEPVSGPSDSPAPAEEPQQDELLAQDEVADLGTPVVEEVSVPDAEAASTPDATDVATVNAARWQTVRRNLFHIASEVVEPLAGTSRQRTFHYVVTEETRSPAGVTNDLRSTRDIYITVTDDGHGKLTAEFTDANGASLTAGQPDLTFTNVYKPAPTPSRVTDQVSVSKVLTGRSMVAGEFCFEMLEDGKVVATGTNAADGTVALSPITYDVPGTHSYEIREVNAGKTIDGVRYSGTTYHVNTTVSDTGDGALAVKHELVEEGPATFTNAYETTPADVTITAHKELLGATLTDGQFAFQLTGMGSDLRATNDAQGNVAFPHLLLTEPGTYTYELRELNDGQEGVTYDERVFALTVTVVDDGFGHLSATVTTDAPEGSLAFENTYTPPTVPEEPAKPTTPSTPSTRTKFVPKTGDPVESAPIVVGAVLGVAVLGIALVVSKRGNRG